MAQVVQRVVGPLQRILGHLGPHRDAGRDVEKFVPVVPYVWASSAVAVKSNVKGYVTGPIGPVNEPFANVRVG